MYACLDARNVFLRYYVADDLALELVAGAGLIWLQPQLDTCELAFGSCRLLVRVVNLRMPSRDRRPAERPASPQKCTCVRDIDGSRHSRDHSSLLLHPPSSSPALACAVSRVTAIKFDHHFCPSEKAGLHSAALSFSQGLDLELAPYDSSRHGAPIAQEARRWSVAGEIPVATAWAQCDALERSTN